MANLNYFKEENLRLELHIDGALFNSLEIDEEDILPNYYSFKFRVPMNEKTISLHVSSFEEFFSRQIKNANHSQFYLVVESKINLIEN